MTTQGLRDGSVSIRFENCNSMMAYVTQLIETSQKLKGIGFNINEAGIGSLLLAGLSKLEKYSPMINNMLMDMKTLESRL